MASSSSDGPTGASLPRESLVDTAVRFLTNPNVVDRPFQQKLSFLKSKGMTDEEVRISCERANVHPSNTHQQQHLSSVIPMPTVPQYIVNSQEKGLWIRLRDVLHTLALLGGLGYAIYWVYKAYIEPFLFGRPKPKKSTEERLSSIEDAVSNVSRCTNELRTEIRSELSRLTHTRESGTIRNLSDIKSDIATVKGLLLSRQQFPSAPTSTSFRMNPSSKPSIPVWQMSIEQKNDLKNVDEQCDDKEPPIHSVDMSTNTVSSKDYGFQNIDDKESVSSNQDVDKNEAAVGEMHNTVTNGSGSTPKMASD